MERPEIKILVVDDREDNLFSIETILEKDGYTIVKANSGMAALKSLLQKQDFTLILMDVQMPGMNGFETANMIYERDRLRDIPIIFITANDYGEEYIFKGYQMGGVDYIYKPIDPELLRVKVSVFVEMYRKTQQLVAQEKKLLAMNKSLEKEIQDRIISEEKIRLLNQQLLENNAHLKATNEELNRFAYVASHDLQEPLRKIMVFSDKMGFKFKDQIHPEMADYLQKITNAAERMQLLIKDLLKYSRQTSVDDDDYEVVDVKKLVQEVLSDMEVEIEQRRAVITVDDLPVLSGYPSQLRQLFQNLISNSLKFSRPDREPRIRVSATLVSDGQPGKGMPGTHYRIAIADNGIGFDPKYTDDIFVVFKRLHSYHEFAGTGVGLSICKKIVERHKGYIEASSALGEGAVFTIGLPEKHSSLQPLLRQTT
ncbi:sensor histidine kinase [Chitinophaga parva]|nr:response regulator [Chitinophaga parva]